MLVKDCPTDAMHSFQIRTLRSLGYRTRVALSNKSHERPEFRTDYRVDLSVYNAGQGRTGFVEGIGTLPAGGRFTYDCTPHDTGAHDSVLVFHMVPTQFAGPTADVERDALMFWNGAQDHFVEYFRDDGCAAGVLYQNGPFNHPKLSPKGTTLIQAPKFYVSSSVDSVLSVINASADAGYDRVVKLRLTLVGDGVRCSWVEDIEPFVPAAISMREQVRARGIALTDAPRFVCLYAACENATLIPLTIVRHDATGAIGIEHSLPPEYYSALVKGPARQRVMDQLDKSALFEVTP